MIINTVPQRNKQKLTCAQPPKPGRRTPTSSWSVQRLVNGLAKKHFFHPSRGVRLEHEVIVHCKANPDIRVIDAIAVILKDERVARGIEMK